LGDTGHDQVVAQLGPRGGLGGYALDLIDEITRRSHPDQQA
jgi:hypothetical protein